MLSVYYDTPPMISPTPAAVSDTNESNLAQCTNYSTKITPLWRRDPSGNALCNACGLFLKLHSVVQPLLLKKDVIEKRNRNNFRSSKDFITIKKQRQQEELFTTDHSPSNLSSSFDSSFICVNNKCLSSFTGS